MEYAKTLNITTVHLNCICRAVAHKTALAVVHEHIISEAKKYLLHTSYTITVVIFNVLAYSMTVLDADNDFLISF